MDRPDPLLSPAGPSWLAFQAPGDVVLTTGMGPAAVVNRLVQSAVEGSWARATHAMLVAAPGVYLDAGPRQGVALVPADRYVFADRARPGARRRRLEAVLRHPELATSEALRAELARVARAFCGRGYNFRFVIGPPRRMADRAGAFCSELVVEVFARLGWRLVPDRPAHAVLPHTLLRVLPALGFRDVTELYARGLGRSDG